VGVFLIVLALVLALLVMWAFALPAVLSAYAIIATATPSSPLMTVAAWIAATVLLVTGVALLVAWRRSIRRVFGRDDSSFGGAFGRYLVIVYLLAIGASAIWGLVDVDPYLGSSAVARSGIGYTAGVLAVLPILTAIFRSQS
jgi:hypothetical protein